MGKYFSKSYRAKYIGKKFSIICVAEGAKAESEEIIIKEKDIKRTDPIRLGGIGEHVAKRISDETGLETRATVLGHLQRGGTPSAYDRILATRYGTKALELAIAGKFSQMVSLRGTSVTSVLIEDAISRQRLVPRDGEVIKTAKAVGTIFGD